MPWLITTTSFIWGICNAGTLLYTLSALKSNLLGSIVLWMAEASGKIPENATLYCVVAVLILICCTGLHTLIYLMKGRPKSLNQYQHTGCPDDCGRHLLFIRKTDKRRANRNNDGHGE